jgi:cell division protein FtsI (penicillin-binding protein 3)
VNNPQIVVAVILDSAVGPHQGGQVAAPVFKRISQQVLEYLHVPHDLPLAPQHQLLLARAKTKDNDLEEGTPDHPGEPLETAEVNGDAAETGASANAVTSQNLAQAVRPTNGSGDGRVVQAAIRQSETVGQSAKAPNLAETKSPLPARDARNGAPGATDPATRDPAIQPKLPASGTVVLDVEPGGIEVPSFVGKTVRGAVEAAQDAGLELEAVGSGLARQQSPAAGAHVAAGSRVTVEFGR